MNIPLLPTLRTAHRRPRLDLGSILIFFSLKEKWIPGQARNDVILDRVYGER